MNILLLVLGALLLWTPVVHAQITLGPSVPGLTAPPPHITSISPTSGTQGDTGDVIQVLGSGFDSGCTVTFSGTGITVNSTSFVNSGECDANIDIAGGATASVRNVTLTNGDSQS